MRSGTDPVAGSPIEFDNISKRYGSLEAVKDFSLKIRAGEFVSLLGPSGSGKTTLLMMLAGFELPSAGRIRVGNRDLTTVPPNKRDIGLVFQRYALFPHLTVAQNIAFPLRMRKVPKDKIAREVERIVSLVQLNGMESRLPNQLSGGQQQRVAVGRALVFSPSVLLMDEPLGALDKKLREQMQIEIRSLQQSLGVTVMYVTHDQDEALTMSDRVAVINKGALAQIGPPADIYRQPANAFVADFVGKMNFIEAVCEGEERGETILRAGEGTPIRASAAGHAYGKGQRVQVALRPEQLLIVGADAQPPYALHGKLETVVFVGSVQVYLVRIFGMLIQVHSLAGGSSELRQGEDVQLAYDPAGVRLFPA